MGAFRLRVVMQGIWASCLVGLAFVAFAPAASADVTVCASGTGAGQCGEPQALALDSADALLYVADRGNRRVDVFDAGTGAFLRAFGWGVASSAAALEVCTVSCLAGLAGEGRGQFNGLTGVAIDDDPLSPDQHDVYTFESSNARVQRLNPNGSFVLMFGGEVNKTKVEAGAPTAEQNVCPVDPGDVCQKGTSDTVAGTTAGDTPGVTPGFFRGNAKIAVGPGGIVHLADNTGGNVRLQRFDSGGQPVTECAALPPGGFGNGMQGLAIDGASNIYTASNNVTGAVRKHTPGCALLEPPSPVNLSLNINAVALDAAGDIFVGDSTGVATGGETGVYEYDAAGATVRVFYGNGTLASRPHALALFAGANGDIFAAEQNPPRRVLHLAFPPPGPVVHPDPKFTQASSLSNTKATLSARVNPEGEETKLHFEYVDDATYRQDIEALGPGHGFDHALRSPPNPGEDPIVGAANFTLAGGSVQVGCPNPDTEAGQPGNTCLTPETEYHFRAVATNASAPGGRPGPEGGAFTTSPPLEILDTFATAVGTDTAKLHATVSPLGIPTTGRFQYINEASFQQGGFAGAEESAQIDFGSGEGPITRATEVPGLEPDTIYRYRLLATDPLIEDDPVEGPERALLTYPLPPAGKTDCPNQALRGGPSVNLPDCRAYEMVSPLEKNNGDVLGQEGITLGNDGHPPARVDQAARDGETFTYGSFRSFGDAQSSPFASQYMAVREEETGWATGSINAPKNIPSLYDHLGKETPFKGFSGDLCKAWYLQDSDYPLVEGAPPGVPNLYRRFNCVDAGECPISGQLTGDCYELVSTVAPPGFGKDIDGTSSLYNLTMGGWSADGDISFFKAPAKLAPEAVEPPVYQTYVYGQGAIHLVSRLPGGEAAETHSGVGTPGGTPADFRSDNVFQAVAADGSRVFWSAEIAESSPNGVRDGDLGGEPSRLFVRLNPTTKQSAVNGSDECTEAAKACTVQISTGAAVFHTANPAATKAIYSEGSDLFEVDVDAAVAYEAGAASPIAGEVDGFVGASEDAIRVYFVSREDLDGAGEAAAGESNLYLHEAGAPIVFVATLMGGGVSGDGRVTATRPLDRRARVSEDGLHALFMSRAPLTGYDNTHIGSPSLCGEPGGVCDAEVFLYDAAEQKLRCVSCNPSGGRPLGAHNFSEALNVLDWVAARIPGWETQWQPSRLISEDGQRVFFESFEGLVLRDTNGKKDIYEWVQAGGESECLGGIGGELYVAASEGCLSLISSGESQGASEFIDASASGSDVFFATVSSLVPQDYGLVDIYDARAQGGFPPPPPPKLPCEGEACQSPPAAPEDPTPASATFQGQGNLRKAPPRCPKGKRRVRRGGKERCVAKKKRQRKRKHTRQRRAVR